MKYWAPLLHIYQPFTQDVNVLKRINRECYVPLFDMLERNPYARITLNINGVLIDLLNDYGLGETVQKLVRLVDAGIVEIMGTAKYHPLLPLIREKDIKKQIVLNEETNYKTFGSGWSKKGFFPPEMAISDTVLRIVAESGYSWIIASGIACTSEWAYRKIYHTKYGMKIFFRDDIISNQIAFKQIDPVSFIERVDTVFDPTKKNGPKDNNNNGTATPSESPFDYYIITAMDGETFGHHIPHYETDFLETALKLAEEHPEIEICFVSDLLDKFPDGGVIEPRDSSWSTSYSDILNNIPYPLWKHPYNPVHKVQYRMLKSLEKLMGFCEKYADSESPSFRNYYNTAVFFYDRSLYSCPMWWASMRPSWSPNLIYDGGNLMYKAALNCRLALIEIGKAEGDETYDIFINYYRELLEELIRQSTNLKNIRTF